MIFVAWWMVGSDNDHTVNKNPENFLPHCLELNSESYMFDLVSIMLNVLQG